MPCTRDNYVRNYVTEAKDRDKILALGPRECENPKEITKRAKISTPPKSPCKCECFLFHCNLMPPPKPVMKIDYARLAANELAEKQKKLQENVLARVREEIIQHDKAGTGQFRVSETLPILSHKARVRVHLRLLHIARAVTHPVHDFQASALQDELKATLTALGKLCHVCKYECVYMEPYPLTRCGTCTLVVHAATVHDDLRPCSYKLSQWYDTVICAPCRRDALRVDLSAD